MTWWTALLAAMPIVYLITKLHDRYYYGTWRPGAWKKR